MKLEARKTLCICLTSIWCISFFISGLGHHRSYQGVTTAKKCFFVHPRSQNQIVNFSELGDTTEHCGDVMTGILVWATLSALCSVVGCPACVAVLWELFQRKAGTPFIPNNVFMLNLTIMDLMFLSFVPFGLCNVLLWNLRSIAMVSNFLYALNLAGQPLLTACIWLDCYLTVVHPVIYLISICNHAFALFWQSGESEGPVLFDVTVQMIYKQGVVVQFVSLTTVLKLER